MVSIGAQAQLPPSFVYVNNQDVQNHVSAYAVNPNGSLTEVLGSPYLTGGAGETDTCFGLDRIVTNFAKNLLFVSNGGDQTISVFQINPATGALTPTPGSPFASGLSLDSCGAISVAVTPDGQFMMAASAGTINSFSVAATGALTPVATATNTFSPTVGMKVSPNGQFLAITSRNEVSVYAVSSTGSLTPTAGSPFAKTGTADVAGVEFSCSTDRVYAAETTGIPGTITDAWSMDPTGVLTPVVGSPFGGHGATSTNLTITPNNSVLFTGDQAGDLINAFSIAADGSLTFGGFLGGPPSIHTPMAMATDYAGTLMAVADDPFGVAVFKIVYGPPILLNSTASVQLANPIEVLGTAVYPPKACAPLNLAITEAGPTTTIETGSTVTYNYTLTNNEVVAVPGSIGWDMPAGTNQLSCTPSAGGVCSTLGTQNNASFASIPAGTSVTASVVVQTSTDLVDQSTVTNHAVAYSSIGLPSGATASATATFTVSANSSTTTLTVAPVTAIYGGLATLTASLQKDTVSGPINGKTIVFSLNGTVIGSALTNAAGVASRPTTTTGLVSGATAAITATFAGDTVFGASSGGNTLTIAPATLTVTAANASMVYGGTFPATLNSSISGFVNGDTSAVVTGVAVCSTTATAASTVGSYPITCNTSGLSAANYVFVSVPGTFTVTQAPLTITVADATRAYQAADPVFTGTVSGLIGTDTVTVTYSSTATATSPVGFYSIFPILAPDAISANYRVVAHTGILTITGAALTLTGNDASRLYGDPNPSFSGTIAGLLPGDVITATFTTAATPASAVGVYPITPVFSDPGNKLGNYTVTVIPGNLTINQAPLTATTNDAAKIYGLANPVFTGTITGLKNGDAITESFSTTAVLTSPVGTYPITPALVDPTGKAGNYIVTFVNGTLTVLQAPLTVNINNATRLYGAANPGFTGTLVGLRAGDAITATYSSVATPASPVGTYAITPAFTDPGAKLPNYVVTITGGILTVTPAPLTITAGGGQRIYGSANPAGTVAGLKNADVITVTSTSPTINSPVGTYTVTPIPVDPGGAIGNYTVTLKTATLTITKAALRITANNATVVLNTAAPGFTATYSGFVAGDTVANLTGVLSCTAPLNTVGAKTITCSGQTSPNYTITFVNGTATVVFASAGACTAGPGHQILAPIAADGSTIFTRATTASIPVQFRVCDANGATVNITVVSKWVLLQRITGGVTTNVNQTQNAVFNFNAAAQDDLATLSTSTPTNLTAGTTYLYQITLIDNSTINFQFTMN